MYPEPDVPGRAADGRDGQRIDPPHDDLLPRRRPERSLAKRLAFLLVGAVLVVIGVVLGILPVLPGWPLTILGILVLSMADHRVRRVINWGDRKLPHRMRHGLRWARDRSGLKDRLGTQRREKAAPRDSDGAPNGGNET
ncbi:MAG: PGPGW domain-containing protein [Phycisphaerales bacterium]